jgi:signal transduction histidine kinase
MEKILEYSGTLSLLYITTKVSLPQETYKRLEPFFEMVTVANSMHDYLQQYRLIGTYPDIVMVDTEAAWEKGQEIIKLILQRVPQQMIVVVDRSFSKEQCMALMELKITYLLEKPFESDALFRVTFDTSKALHERRLELSKQKMLSQQILDLDKQLKANENTQKSKDQFFASISHEIRTPINAVIGLSHILLNNSPLDEKSHDYVKKIHTSGNLILHIVNDLLDFSKIEAGKLQIESIKFNINKVLEDLSTMIAFKAQEKGLELIFDIDSSVPTLLKGDPLRLSQILINLLSNAVKFTAKGSITLSAKAYEKSKIEFRVTDTGIGLTQEQITTLFDSFTQATNATSRHYGGSGLGLTISKQLVTLMGGEIWVESQIDQGSTFAFTIKCPSLQEHRHEHTSSTLLNKRVVIFDKNSQSKQALTHLLDQLSYTLLEIETPNNLSKERIDILFFTSDYLQEMEAIESQMPSTKLVLMHTAVESTEELEQESISIDGYLEKPFTQSKTLSTLRKIFGQKSPQAPHESLNKKSLSPIAGASILLVEDNKINQSVIIALLEGTGIEVHVASSGDEAIKVAPTLAPLDLILMDIEMPNMNGYETSMALKKLPPFKETPIVAFSGNVRAVDKARSKEAQMVAHLAKPIDVDAFYGVLLKFIHTKRHLDQRLHDATEEFQALLGVGKFIETIELIDLLIKEATAKGKEERVIELLESIKESILHYEKVFLVLINNYHRAFEKFFKIAEKLERKEKLSKKEEQIISLHQGVSKHQTQESYSEKIGDFCHTFRDSVLVLQERVKAYKFEQAIQLIFQIRRDSMALELEFITNSIAPIVGIEKSQKRQLEESLGRFHTLIKERETNA